MFIDMPCQKHIEMLENFCGSYQEVSQGVDMPLSVMNSLNMVI